MRILLHSNAPWVKTGYGQQAELVAPRFQELGHEVGVSAFYGLAGTEVNWNGIPVYPGGRPDQYGLDMLPYFYRKFEADLTIILADAWVGAKHVQALSRMNVANWLPIDAEPLSSRDFQYLIASGAHPIAMSQFGARMLDDAKLRNSYAPHGIDIDVFTPWTDATDRDQLRHEVGIEPDTFVIGINAANRDMHRKGFFEQFRAFAEFHRNHPNSRLYVHTLVNHPAGLDIVGLAQACGIAGAVLHPDQDPLAAGEIDARSLVRNFYHMIDLYSGCSLAEGFGIPILEAQACGVPVVVTDGSAMTELCAPGGWLVRGEPLWVEGHRSCWTKPNIGQISTAYEDAYHQWVNDPGLAPQAAQAREFALQYDANRVVTEHWKPILEALDGH